MSQYIITKYHGFTNTKPSRAVATAPGKPNAGRKSVTFSSHEGDSESAHREAARLLAEAMGWHGEWVAGHGHAGNVYVNISGGHNGTIDGFRVEPKGGN